MLHLPELLNTDELARTRALLTAATWVDGRGAAGAQAVAVQHNQQLASQGEADTGRLRALQVVVLGALDRHALFISAALPKRVLPPLFNRYGGLANHHGNHVAQAIRYHPGTGQGIRGDLACTLFLSAPADYDGGELVVEDAFGSAHLGAKFAAGDAVLYAGSSVHRVQPVTRGVRLDSVFWVESLVAGAEQRRLLFEMDIALMKLRQRERQQAGGESAETLTLTGTYHNLLRLWAQP